MEVSAQSPFQLVYSLFEHQYLGVLFEPFIVQLDGRGNFTLQHRNISSLNACEFASGLDETDYILIRLMDELHPEVVIKKFYGKKVSATDFFLEIYDEKKGNKLLQEGIYNYLEGKRKEILERLSGKMLFEMGKDGEPAYKKLKIEDIPATVLFHFYKNKDNTHYLPTIKHKGKRLHFQQQGAGIICDSPAFLLLNGHIYTFQKAIDGKKLRPFLNKNRIIIPKKIELTYFKRFVCAVVRDFDVHAKGFQINKVETRPKGILRLAKIPTPQTLFDTKKEEEDKNIVLELLFVYQDFNLHASPQEKISVIFKNTDDNYFFYKIFRDSCQEQKILDALANAGLKLKKGKLFTDKSKAFGWLNKNRALLEGLEIKVQQDEKPEVTKYFLGEAVCEVEITEKNDWFDVKILARFGSFEIPFAGLRRYILSGQKEFMLPNGELAVIPEAWFSRYADLFYFVGLDGGKPHLEKQYLSLVNRISSEKWGKVEISQSIQKLKTFEKITEQPLPKGFSGKLRAYQQAGFNWLQFLSDYNFGGCLADDMGLGKTVQTLALLQAQKEKNETNKQAQLPASLLVMPTSLLYNWQMEAKKFTPQLRVLRYTGTHRSKNSGQFDMYDLVLTSYGIVRLDINFLANYCFNYIVLDESQVIKNPSSNITKAVNRLKSKKKLILTGTPIENSTLDLWSQMNFVNKGLLGSQSFFKKKYLLPIERHKNEEVAEQLYQTIRPFVMRRHKAQVATELPGKVEKVQYCQMSAAQEEIYEKTKSAYRNQILKHIENEGIAKSQFVLLEGLSKLRQIANHPKMIFEESGAESGKMSDTIYMLENIIKKTHKVLIFSQFVKHLNLLRKEIEQRQIPYAYLDGSTRNRQQEINRFQQNANVPLFLISLKAGGLGLNLTAAEYVFILDPWWNPATEAQAIDRAYRIGQQNKVFIYKFITQNTVEEKILALQENKRKLAETLITTEDSFVKTLSKSDIERLLT